MKYDWKSMYMNFDEAKRQGRIKTEIRSVPAIQCGDCGGVVPAIYGTDQPCGCGNIEVRCTTAALQISSFDGLPIVWTTLELEEIIQ